jgi:CheY-like chemotaxis protein
MRVLVVEDDEANLYLATFLLEEAGAEVVSARDGASGVRLAAGLSPDVVVMDVSLPGLDGFEALRALRSDARTADMPILAATAFAQPGERERMLRAGFDDYVEKPLDVSNFAARVRAWAGRRGGSKRF